MGSQNRFKINGHRIPNQEIDWKSKILIKEAPRNIVHYTWTWRLLPFWKISRTFIEMISVIETDTAQNLINGGRLWAWAREQTRATILGSELWHRIIYNPHSHVCRCFKWRPHCMRIQTSSLVELRDRIYMHFDCIWTHCFNFFVTCPHLWF